MAEPVTDAGARRRFDAIAPLRHPAYARLWSSGVNTVDFGGKASERQVSHDIDVVARDYYFNFVTEMWYTSRLAIEANQVRGMSEDLILEGCAREYLRVGNNKIQVEPKAEMKAKSGRSPDLFDCFALGLEGAIRKGFEVRRLVSPDSQPRDSRWKRELREKAEAARKIGTLNHAA